MHQNRTVEARHELIGGGGIFGDNTIGVLRAVSLNMRGSGVQIVHNARRDDHVQVFRAPIAVGRRHGASNRLQGRVRAHLDACRDKRLNQGRTDLGERIFMDQQTLCRAANPGSTRLGV